MNANQRFEQFLNGGEGDRPAFAPLIRGLAARTQGMSRQGLTQDPTLWANSLIKAADLLDLDAIVTGFDTSLLAASCGCPITWEEDRPEVCGVPNHLSQEICGPLAHALDTAQRVFDTCRQNRAGIAALSGPATLARQLFGSSGQARIKEVKAYILPVLKAYCDTRPHAVLFMETCGFDKGLTLQHRKIYNTLKNITAYYGIPAGLYLEGYDMGGILSFSALDMDIYVLGRSAQGDVPGVEDLAGLTAGSPAGFGLGLPMDDFDAACQLIDQGAEQYATQNRCGVFFTSLGPLTRDADLDMLHQVVKKIKEKAL